MASLSVTVNQGNCKPCLNFLEKKLPWTFEAIFNNFLILLHLSPTQGPLKQCQFENVNFALFCKFYLLLFPASCSISKSEWHFQQDIPMKVYF